MRLKIDKFILSGVIITSFCLGFFVTPALAQAQTERLNPKIANYFLKWSITPAEATELAKWDVLILDMETQVKSPGEIARIRQLNPHITILAYITPQEILDNAASSWSSLRRSLVVGIHPEWELKNTSGEWIVFWPGTHMLNISTLCPSVDGYKFNHYLAHFVATNVLGSGVWDGVFYDNAWDSVTWVTKSSLDLDVDGKNDADVNGAWRDGLKYLFNETRRASPRDKIVLIGNHPNATFRNELNGMMLENFGNQLSWADSMRLYEKNHTGTQSPRLNIINRNTANRDRQDDYKSMRFGLTSALLEDGYYSFDRGSNSHNELWWYDEYDVNMGKAVGQAYPVSGVVEDFKNDVWRRDFSEGTALVNATDKPTKIDLGEDYEKISGHQDKTVNDGAIVSEVELSSNDGIILMKTNQTTREILYRNGDFLRFFNARGERSRNGYFAYDENLPAGSKLYTGDLDGDSKNERIIVTGARMEILDSQNRYWFQDFPFGADYKGELYVAVGNVNSQSKKDILVSGSTGGKVTLYNYFGGIIKKDFYPLGTSYRGGFQVAAGNVDGGDTGEAVLGLTAGKPAEVLVYDSTLTTVLKRFFPFDKKYTGGVAVAAANVFGDQQKEIVVGRVDKSRLLIRIFDRAGKKLGEFSTPLGFGGARFSITAVDINFDGKDEIAVVGSG